MPRIDLEPKAVGLNGGGSNPLKLLVLLGSLGVGKCPGVQLYSFGSELFRGLDLAFIGFDEHAHPHPGGLEAPDSGFELFEVADDIQAAFGGDLLAAFGNHANILGQNPQGNLEDLCGVAHFQVKLGNDARPEPLDIAVLDMATIRAEMGCNAMGSRAFANTGRRDQIRLAILGVKHAAVARLTKRCDVIDVYA